MSGKKIATSTLWQIASQATTLILGILSIKIVTTALSQELVGNYQTVYAFIQIFAILADFGLYAVAIRELSRSQNESETLGAIIALRTVITILSFAVAISLAWALPMFVGTPLPLGIAIASLVPFFTLLAGTLRTVFQVRYAMHYVYIAEVVGKIIPVTLMICAVLTGVHQSANVSHYYMFLAFGGCGSLTLFLLSLTFVRKFFQGLPRFSKEEFWRLLKLSAPYGIIYLLMTIYRQGDVTLIALLRPQDYDIQNAYYGTALRLAEVGYLFPTFLLNSALPIFEERPLSTEAGRLLAGKLFTLLFAAGGVMFLFCFLWSVPIISFVTRESYIGGAHALGADTALILLALPILCSAIISFCFYMLLHLHAWRMLLVCTGLAAVCSVGLNMLFIPSFGLVGAGFTSILVHSTLAVALLLITTVKTKFTLVFRRFLGVLITLLCVAGLLVLFLPFAKGMLLTPILTIGILCVTGVLLQAIGIFRMG